MVVPAAFAAGGPAEASCNPRRKEGDCTGTAETSTQPGMARCERGGIAGMSPARRHSTKPGLGAACPQRCSSCARHPPLSAPQWPCGSGATRCRGRCRATERLVSQPSCLPAFTQSQPSALVGPTGAAVDRVQRPLAKNQRFGLPGGSSLRLGKRLPAARDCRERRSESMVATRLPSRGSGKNTARSGDTNSTRSERGTGTHTRGGVSGFGDDEGENYQVSGKGHPFSPTSGRTQQ